MGLHIKQRHPEQSIASGELGQTVRIFEGHWYFAPEAVNPEYLKVSERTYTCSYKGTCYWIDLETPDLRIENFAWVYRDPKPNFWFIKDRIGFYVRDTDQTVAVQD